MDNNFPETVYNQDASIHNRRNTLHLRYKNNWNQLVHLHKHIHLSLHIGDCGYPDLLVPIVCSILLNLVVGVLLINEL
jgi:hypothetical protein